MTECIFCKVASGEIPGKVVYEDEKVKAFLDINPQAPVHIVLIPKQHMEPKLKLSSEEVKVVADIFAAAQKIAKDLNVDLSGFRLIANVGSDAGQEIAHLHFHLLGGTKLGPLIVCQ